MNINKNKFRYSKNYGGFSLLEAMVVIFFISIIGVVALSYYYKLLVDIEQTTMAYNLGVMRSAVSMQVAKAYVSGDKDILKTLIGSNPVDLLKDKPDNYVGEVSSAAMGQAAKGSWFYDPQQGILNYQVRNTLYFESALKSSKVARFRIEPVFAEQKSTRGIRRISGLELKEQESYRWLRPWD